MFDLIQLPEFKRVISPSISLDQGQKSTTLTNKKLQSSQSSINLNTLVPRGQILANLYLDKLLFTGDGRHGGGNSSEANSGSSDLGNRRQFGSSSLKVMHIVSDDLWGGAETQALILLDGLRHFISVALLTFNDGQTSKRARELSDITLRTCNESEGIKNLIKYSYNFAREFRPNIIHSHGYKEGFIASIISALMGVRWIHQIHGSSENYQGRKLIKSIFYQNVEKIISESLAKKIIFASEKSKLDLGYGNISRSSVVYNAAVVEEGVKEGDENKEVVKIFLLGRLAPIKRFDIAIKTFAYLLEKYSFPKPLELHILGSGPLEEDLKELVETYPHVKNKIYFHGFVDNPDRILRNDCDIMLMTSDNEGVPTSILECLLLKIPVLSRSVGGIPEIKKAVPAYPLILVKSRDPQVLADTLREMVLNLNTIKKEASFIDCSYFKPSRLISDHLDIYNNL